jgi:hypothetical protein
VNSLTPELENKDEIERLVGSDLQAQRDKAMVKSLQNVTIGIVNTRFALSGLVLLGKHGKIRPRNREFAFTGLMHCGECDSTITAEEKNQIICSDCKTKFAYENKTQCPKCNIDISEMHNPTVLNYVYYHCTKKKNRNCTQKTIRLEELESQFNKILDEITIDEDYLNLAFEYLQDKQKNAGGEEKAIRQTLQSAFDSCQTRLRTCIENLLYLKILPMSYILQ